MIERQRETIAKRLKVGEEPWIALVYPKGVKKEDVAEAEDYARENGIHTFTHKNIAIVFYANEANLASIILNVAYAVRS
jgi:hypothetical protein